MSAVVEAVSDAVSSAVEAVGTAVEDVGQVLGDVGKAIDDYVIQPIVDDPLTAVATIAGAALLGPAIAPALGFLGPAAGAVGAGLGAAAGNFTAGMAQGEAFDEAITGAAIAGVAAGVTQGAFDYFGGAEGAAPGSDPGGFGGAGSSSFGGGEAFGGSGVPVVEGASSVFDDFALSSLDDAATAGIGETASAGLGQTAAGTADDVLTSAADDVVSGALDDAALPTLEESLKTGAQELATPDAPVVPPTSPLTFADDVVQPLQFIDEPLTPGGGVEGAVGGGTPTGMLEAGSYEIATPESGLADLASKYNVTPDTLKTIAPDEALAAAGDDAASAGVLRGLRMPELAPPRLNTETGMLDYSTIRPYGGTGLKMPEIVGYSEPVFDSVTGELISGGTPQFAKSGLESGLGKVSSSWAGETFPTITKGLGAPVAPSFGQQASQFLGLDGTAGQYLSKGIDFVGDNFLPIAVGGATLMGAIGGEPQSQPPMMPTSGSTRPASFDERLKLYNYLRDRQAIDEQTLANYGRQGGEHEFFQNVRFVPVEEAKRGGLMQAQRYADGGQVQLSPLAQTRQVPQNPNYDYYSYGTVPYAQGGRSMVRSPAVHAGADGRSDDVNAVLSDGEYVMDAETVALLGNGSNQAGAKRLDDMRAQVRKQKGGALSKGKFSPDAKSPLSYMRG